MKILITGAAGFLASGIIRRLSAARNEFHIRALARNSSQKHFQRLTYPVPDLVYGDLTGDINGLCEGVDTVIHAAALTYVDRSILSPSPFIQNNIIGTFNLLEDARRYGVKRFIQISTDEVLGPILEGAHKEDAPTNPSNPYSASKAGAEALCIAYARTFGLNTLIIRFENLYGPFQHPQKVIPTFSKALMHGEKMPVYGDGGHSRTWLHLSDAVEGILHLLNLNTSAGEIFHVAGGQELTNLDLAEMVADCFQVPFEDSIRYVDDRNIRPGHDRRYCLDTTKIKASGWVPRIHLADGIAETVAWYRKTPDWLT